MPTHKTPGPLVIREGRYYRRRDGTVRGPMETRPSPMYPWADNRGSSYSAHGLFCAIESGPIDLISEVPSPTPPAKPAVRKLSGKAWAVIFPHMTLIFQKRSTGRLVKGDSGRVIRINWSEA